MTSSGLSKVGAGREEAVRSMALSGDSVCRRVGFGARSPDELRGLGAAGFAAVPAFRDAEAAPLREEEPDAGDGLTA